MDGDTELSGCVIGAAIEVHQQLGPGLLESAYRACLVRELRLRGQRVQTEVAVDLVYRGLRLDCAYRADLIVESALLVELKSVHQLEAIHTARLLTYLRLTGLALGLLINFNVPFLSQGIRRVILTPRPPAHPLL